MEELLDAGVRIFHFDVGDGHFVEPVTIGPVVLEALAPIVHARGGVLDCHLMVTNPDRHIPQIADAGGDSVTFHIEVTDDPAPLVRRRVRAGSGSACPSTRRRRSKRRSPPRRASTSCSA